jgi:NAD(P)-dependent dehydrogenase (short-subunit alcohol dehydrogenase family)
VSDLGTKSLARALAPAIRVNAVAPGLVPTGFGGFGADDWGPVAARTPIGGGLLTLAQ